MVRSHLFKAVREPYLDGPFDRRPDPESTEMPNISSRNQNEGKWEIEMEADLSAAAAVTATRGTNVVCTKTGVGTYSFVIKGTSALKVHEMLNRDARLSGTPATALFASVTGVSQATDGSDDVTVTVKTHSLTVSGALGTAATMSDADTTGACVLSVKLVARVIRMSNPLA